METNFEIPVIWQDEHTLVINKPAGLLSLPDGYDPSKAHLKSVLVPQFGLLWIVHRLDRDTSGVMILARNEAAHRELNIQFQERRVMKYYQALVNGNPAWDSILVDQPLSTNQGHRNRTVVDFENGKPAVTRFDVLRRFGSFALVSAAPNTGRRHQIRAHLASLGHPVAGDKLYGGEKSFQDTDFVHNNSDEVIVHKLHLDRPGLHAERLELTHPFTNQWVAYQASYPDDFQITIDNLSEEIG